MRSPYDALNNRTKQFAVDVILFVRQIESLPVIRWVARQLVDAATSVAANQRAARRFRSNRELQALSLPAALAPELDRLTDEAQQLVAIFAKGRSTVRSRLRGALIAGLAVGISALSFGLLRMWIP